MTDIAYCGPPPGAAELIGRWNFDPWLLLAFVAASIAWRLSARGRSLADTRAFTGAMIVLAIAFISPLCAATAALFSARVVHHVLLVAVAAPLLALAGVCGGKGSASNPVALPLVIAMGIFYAWHAPPLYAAALKAPAVYWLMQASLLASAAWFWACVFRPATPPATALLAILATAASMGLLGALLTFAPQPLYVAHLVAPYAFGLTPLDDQRLAGLIMWVPALVPYLVLAGLATRRWACSASRADAGARL